MELLLVFQFVVFGIFVFLILKSCKKCPPDKIMVVYGKVGHGNAARCYRKAFTFVWPLLQKCEYIDNISFTVNTKLQSAVFKDGQKASVCAEFEIFIPDENQLMKNAATHLFHQSKEEISKLAQDAVIIELQNSISVFHFSEYETDQTQFHDKIQNSIEEKLNILGLSIDNFSLIEVKKL